MRFFTPGTHQFTVSLVLLEIVVVLLILLGIHVTARAADKPIPMPAGVADRDVRPGMVKRSDGRWVYPPGTRRAIANLERHRKMSQADFERMLRSSKGPKGRLE